MPRRPAAGREPRGAGKGREGRESDASNLKWRQQAHKETICSKASQSAGCGQSASSLVEADRRPFLAFFPPLNAGANRSTTSHSASSWTRASSIMAMT
jgi:hypothetical protein